MGRKKQQIRYDLIDHPRYKYVLIEPHFHWLWNWPENFGRAYAADIVAPVTRDPHTGAALQHPMSVPLVRLTSGRIEIGVGYAWDGSSGPALDTVNFMRGSLIHDALYQIIPTLPAADRAVWKQAADRELVDICGEDGMNWLRRQWVYLAVRWGGHPKERYHPLPPDFDD